MTPPQLETVCVRLIGVNPRDAKMNMESVQGSLMKPSTLLCSFAATGGPYMHINYSNVSNEFALALDDPALGVLHFVLTDNEGNDLTFLPEHTIVIRVDTYQLKTTEGLELQREIVNLTKDQMMASALGLF